VERSRLRDDPRVSGGSARRLPFRPVRHGTAPAWRRAAVIAAVLAGISLVLPDAVGNAQPALFSSPSHAAHPAAPQPNLNQLIAQAKQLQHQIDQLSEQYDGLRVKLATAKRTAKVAAQTAARDSAQLVGGERKVAQIAAASYEAGGFDPTMQLATSSDPQSFIDRASTMNHLQTVNGQVVSSLQESEATALRARETSQQQEGQVTKLVSQINQKRNVIENKITQIQSSAYSQALSIASRTGTFPNIDIPGGNTLGAEALRYALSKQGDPYVWGAAGPDQFDCSGLVMWAYGQVGISLPHYTGDQYNSGEHISQDQLEPGDLVFFYPDISHVGMYIGNGMMIDAPDFGVPVHVEGVYWNVYAGAVRIG
jgi:cell wall-associated NlpC family hydrolase